MNKVIILFAVIIYLAAYGCAEQGIPTYDDLTSDRYVFFSLHEEDTTEVSFFFYPGQDEILYPLIVLATGAGLVDETYKVNVIEKETTAPAGTYEVPENPVMRAGLPSDTLWVKLVKTELMNTTKVTLVMELLDSEDFVLGETVRRKAAILFHNIISQPPWWDWYMENSYLGTYSDKKYLLFLEAVGVDLSDATKSEIRYYSLLFKKYLKEEKDAGRTVYEDDGTEMVVSVLGNLV